MYVLDTNTFSEVIKQQPNEQVLNKFRQYQHSIYLASIVWHELIYGISVMPNGKKKQRITKFFADEVGRLPILNYTKSCTCNG